MDTNNDKIENKKEAIKIYINVEPLGLKFSTTFKKSETFQSPVNFVLNQFKKLGLKFELGKIIEDKSGALILTEFLIGDILEKDDQITIYSEEYGFIKTNLPGDNDHNSSKKNFYLKSVSDLYRSKTFLKNKRKEKQNQKNENKKKPEAKEEKDEEDESNKDEESKKKIINKNGKKEEKEEKEDKNGKNFKSEKKEKKVEEKTDKKKQVKNQEKKDKQKYLSSESESEAEKEKEKEKSN